MSAISLTRRYGFPAAHVLRSPALPEEENRRIFGKCANPAGHGHDYALEIRIGGEVDPRTGHLLPPGDLDRLVSEEVLDRFGWRLLNLDPAFAREVPTTENLARLAARLLAPRLEGAGVRLLGIRIEETGRNAFAWGEIDG